MPDEKIIVNIDPDLQNLIPGFLQNRSLDVEKLQLALEDNDIKNLGAIGHSIKGVGGGYGFDLMSEIGANIETAANENNIDAVRENINRLDDYLKCIEVKYA